MLAIKASEMTTERNVCVWKLYGKALELLLGASVCRHQIKHTPEKAQERWNSLI